MTFLKGKRNARSNDYWWMQGHSDNYCHMQKHCYYYRRPVYYCRHIKVLWRLVSHATMLPPCPLHPPLGCPSTQELQGSRTVCTFRNQISVFSRYLHSCSALRIVMATACSNRRSLRFRWLCETIYTMVRERTTCNYSVHLWR